MDTTQTTPLPRMSVATYEPKEGETITVELPNERTRAVIIKVISPTAAIAKITQYTTAFHSHPHKKDDLIACKYEILTMNLRGWRAMSDRELAEIDPDDKPEEPAAKPGKRHKTLKKEEPTVAKLSKDEFIDAYMKREGINQKHRTLDGFHVVGHAAHTAVPVETGEGWKMVTG